jgi:hypothetical protein
MLRKSILTIALFACCGEAWATGGFSCEVKDKSVEFEVSAATSRGMGGAILEPAGKLTLKMKSVPEDMRSLDLSKALVHHWVADRTLKLHYYAEREGDKPFASVELVIDTKDTGDDETTKGRYVLSLFTTDSATSNSKTEEIKGRVTCMVE